MQHVGFPLLSVKFSFHPMKLLKILSAEFLYIETLVSVSYVKESRGSKVITKCSNFSMQLPVQK